MPLPRSRAHFRREISVKMWAGGSASTKKYKMPSRQKPDGTAAGSSEWLASRFYQLQTGRRLTGECLNWTKSRPCAQCSSFSCRTQTRGHLFKVCPEWKAQQKILWQR